jgi:hypothetical protein
MANVKKSVVTTTTVRNANNKLMSKTGNFTNIISENSRNGSVSFQTSHSGKTFSVEISRAQINKAFGKALEASKLKK